MAGSKFHRLISAPGFFYNKACSILGAWPQAKVLPAEWQRVPVFCITTRSASARHAMLQKQNKSLGFESFEYIWAPDLSNVSLSELEERGLYDDKGARQYHGRSLRLPEISCSLAHGQAYERIKDLGLHRAIVIEDDALFLSRRFFDVSLTHLPADFELVMFNAERSPQRPVDRIGDGLCGADSFVASAGAYLLSGSGAQKLSRIYKPVVHASDGLLGRSMECDDGIDHPFKQKGARASLRTYMTVDNLVLNGSAVYYYGSSILTSAARRAGH